MLDGLTMDLSQRLQAPELMDQADSDLGRLHRTLQQFALINRWFSRCQTLLKRYVLDDMEADPTRSYHLLDLGTGAGDIPRWLLEQAQRRGFQLRVTGIDADPRIVRWAQQHCDDLDEFEIVEGDGLDLGGCNDVDYVFANHLLHHLEHAQILQLVDAVAALQPRAVVLSDLHRQRSSYLAFSLFAGLCLHGSFAYTDGRQSIRRGFTEEELRKIIAAGPLADRADILTMFPGRVAVVAPANSNGSWKTKKHWSCDAQNRNQCENHKGDSIDRIVHKDLCRDYLV